LLAGVADVSVCNLNAPEQIVVGGATAAVAEFVARCGEAGLRAAQLPVAAAFHTPHVGHALEEFGRSVHETDITPPRFPVYANAIDAGYGSDIAVNRRTLIEQIGKPVAFSPRLREMYQDGFRLFVEFGPKSALAELARKTFAGGDDVVVLSADSGPGQDSDRALKQLTARLAVLGLPLSRLNRFVAPALNNVVPRKGMVVSLEGVKHVSADRRAYLDELENPTAAGPGTLLPTDRPAAVSTASEASAHELDAQVAVNNVHVATEHLAIHRDYLNRQLDLAERMEALLQREAERGPRETVITGIAALSSNTIAISQSHQLASEIFERFVGGEPSVTTPFKASMLAGVPAAPTPRWRA
jgi:acyl transferase domain-containing protein